MKSLAEVLPGVSKKILEKYEWWQSLSDEERAEHEARWAEEDRQRRADELAKWRRWDAYQKPARFHDAALTDFSRSVREIVEPWVEEICVSPEAGGLLIAGPTGVGKTRLMWAIYEELSSRSGPRMEVVKLVRLLSRLRPGGDGDEETINKLCQVPILAIDDIGAHKPSEWVNERLYEIVDTRYDNAKPIVATTNRKNLDAVLDDRLSSRLSECCRLVILAGTDRRRGSA